MSVIKFYLYQLVIAIHKVKKAKLIIIKISLIRGFKDAFNE